MVRKNWRRILIRFLVQIQRLSNFFSNFYSPEFNSSYSRKLTMNLTLPCDTATANKCTPPMKKDTILL